MNKNDYIPYIIQVVITIIPLVFFLGKYVNIIDKHEQAIDLLITRLQSTNQDVNFIKGWMSGKQN